MSEQTFTFAIAGAGTRGEFFADWILQHPDAGSVVAVADPSGERRELIGDLCGIDVAMRFESWEKMLAGDRIADVLINATMDRQHAPVCLKAFPKGYHMLLEKPMGTTLADCIAVAAAARDNGCIVAVCHSLRYVPVWREVKRLLDAGAVGEIVSFDQVEGVGPEHFAHSYVRGNWAREADSAFILLAKNCHDIDQFAWMVDRPCLRVSSFGSLGYFRRENTPAGAPDRCTDGCPHEPACLYSAIRIYGPDPLPYRWEQAKMPSDAAARMELLKTSPYGRCVWRGDNDVVDRQVVGFEFDGGVTGTFTMTAFHQMERRLRICGTTGTLNACLETGRIVLRPFADEAETVIDMSDVADEDHVGGDSLVMETLVKALRSGDPSGIPSGTAGTLATHRIVFAAERARREGRVVSLSELDSTDCVGL